MVKNISKKLISFMFVLLLGFIFIAISNYDFSIGNSVSESMIVVDGDYTSKDDVARYINEYNKLPNNFINKQEAKELGYKPSENNLWDVSNKVSIGGDRFFNREKLLPEKRDRIYFEADIDYQGKKRNAKRIVYSNDGLIYYTDDHYDSFTLLYGED